MKDLAVLRGFFLLVAVVLAGLVIYAAIGEAYILAILFVLAALIIVTKGVPAISRRMQAPHTVSYGNDEHRHDGSWDDEP